MTLKTSTVIRVALGILLIAITSVPAKPRAAAWRRGSSRPRRGG